MCIMHVMKLDLEGVVSLSSCWTWFQKAMEKSCVLLNAARNCYRRLIDRTAEKICGKFVESLSYISIQAKSALCFPWP